MRGWILLYSSTPLDISSLTSSNLKTGLYRSVLASSSEMLELWRVSIIPAVTTPLSCSIRLLKYGWRTFSMWVTCKIRNNANLYLKFKIMQYSLLVITMHLKHWLIREFNEISSYSCDFCFISCTAQHHFVYKWYL